MTSLRNTLRVIIFDVYKGSCVFVRSPNGYLFLIDCDRTAGFSPVRYIGQHEVGGARKWKGYELAKFTLTHHHGDHLEDIESLLQWKPCILLKPEGDQEYWDNVSQANQAWARELILAFKQGFANYAITATEVPDWGMELFETSLSTAEAVAISSSANSVTNNASRITVLEYRGKKITIPGDLEKEGWYTLLEDEGRGVALASALEGTDVYVAPHHGHRSGYCQDIVDIMEPSVVVASVESGNPYVDSRYSREEYVSGIVDTGDSSKIYRLITTRNYGSVFIDINASGDLSIHTNHLEDNET